MYVCLCVYCSTFPLFVCVCVTLVVLHFWMHCTSVLVLVYICVYGGFHVCGHMCCRVFKCVCVRAHH